MKTCRIALLALLVLLAPPAVAQTAVPLQAPPAPAAPASPQEDTALYTLVGLGVLVSAALGVGAVATTSKGALV